MKKPANEENFFNASRYVLNEHHFTEILLNQNSIVDNHTLIIFMKEYCQNDIKEILDVIEHYLENPFLQILIHKRDHETSFEKNMKSLLNLFEVKLCTEVLFFRKGSVGRELFFRWTSYSQKSFYDWFWHNLDFEIEIVNDLKEELKIQLTLSKGRRGKAKTVENQSNPKLNTRTVYMLEKKKILKINIMFGSELYFATIKGKENYFIMGHYVTCSDRIIVDSRTERTHQRSVSYSADLKKTLINSYYSQRIKSERKFLKIVMYNQLTKFIPEFHSVGFIQTMIPESLRTLSASIKLNTQENSEKILKILAPLVMSFCQCEVIYIGLENDINKNSISIENFFTVVFYKKEKERVVYIKSTESKKKIIVGENSLIIYESWRFEAESFGELFAFFKPKDWNMSFVNDKKDNIIITNLKTRQKYNIWPVKDKIKNLRKDEL